MQSRHPQSMLGRAVAAVALTVGFYALALTLATAMIAGPIVGWVIEGRGNLWLTIALIFTGVTILRALVPVRAHFVAPGPELTATAQPELYAELRAVADAVGEPLPPAIYLDADVNASVAEISGGLMRGRRRIMILGLPLLASLTPEQLRAVVAHEYGHYVGGDTRFSAWIWRTRVAVLKTVDLLDDGDSWFRRVVVRTPFVLYAKLFLRLTNAISRRAEFAADAVAAQVAGAQTHAEALRATAAAAPAYASYWRDEVSYTLARGRRPPITAGFQRFLGHHEIRAQVDRIVAAEIADGETNPYDSHPTLADRLRAVGAAETGEVSTPQAADSAAALLRDPGALELRLLESRFGTDAVSQLETISWEQTGELYATEGDALAEQHGRAFKHLTVVDAPGAAAPGHGTLSLLRSTLGGDTNEVHDDELLGFWRFVLGRLLLAALRRDGWTVESAPGQPLLCRRGPDTIEPYSEIGQGAKDAESVERWREQCARLGVGQLRLVPQPIGDGAGPFSGASAG